MSGSLKYELPVVCELCQLPKIRNRKEASGILNAYVVISSGHLNRTKNKKYKKVNKNSKFKNSCQEERKTYCDVHTKHRAGKR
jgi:hypothetical protein